MTALFIHPPMVLALVLALAIAGIAWSARWLTQSGAIAAAITGFLVFWLGGGEAAVPLIAFFVSSSALTVLCKDKSRKPGSSDQVGGRTGVQVLANGGVAVVIVAAHRILAYHISVETNRMLQILFLAALASVNSDTWASEIGSRWGGAPRQLSSWRKVAPGTSGSISVIGTLAAAAGSLFIPACTYRLWNITSAELLSVAWAGLLGSLFDSILGAGVQVQFRNPRTNQVTESGETDGQKNVVIRGLPWIDNNVVNFIAAAAGVLFCWVLLHYGLRNVM